LALAAIKDQMTIETPLKADEISGASLDAPNLPLEATRFFFSKY